MVVETPSVWYNRQNGQDINEILQGMPCYSNAHQCESLLIVKQGLHRHVQVKQCMTAFLHGKSRLPQRLGCMPVWLGKVTYAEISRLKQAARRCKICCCK